MAFALQQTTGAASTSPSHSQAAGFGIIGPGNLLVVIGDAVSSATIADSLSHVWTKAAGTGRMTIWYTIVATSSPITVTVTSSQSALISVSLQEWSFAGSVVVASTATGSGTSTAPATGNLTLTATSLVVAGFDIAASGLTYTPGSGFTAGFTVNSGSSEPLATEYNAAQSTTPVAPGFTLSSSSAWTGVSAAFGEVAASQLNRAEAHDSLSASGNAIDAGTFTATGRADTLAGSSVFTTTAALFRTEGSDTGAIAGNNPRTASLASPAAHDAITAPAWCTVAAIARTEAHDNLAASGGFTTAGTLSKTEEDDSLAGISGTMGAGSLTQTGGSDASAALGDARVHGSIIATGGSDALAGAGSGGHAGSIARTEAHDTLAAPSQFTSLATLSVASPGDDRLLTGSVLEYHVYANGGSGAIDYDTPVATTGLLTWTSGVLACGSDWRFGVRCFDPGSGLEEKNLDCSVEIVLDGSCADVTNRPAAPFGLRAFALAGGSVKVEWHFPLTTGGNLAAAASSPRKPVGFHVYIGIPSVSYASPAATVLYSAGFANTFAATLAGLMDGVVYSIGVRAYNASAEEPNTAFVTVTADSTGPSPVVSLVGMAIV